MKRILTIIAFTILAFTTKAQVGSAVSVPLGAWPYILPAWVQLPSDYSTATTTKYAVIIFGHGAGEASGTGATDSTYQAGGYLSNIYNSSGSGGPAYFIEHGGWKDSTLNPSDGKYYKFIVVSPQGNGSWAYHASVMQKVLTYLEANYRVDTNRIYMTGLSAGGETILGYAVNYDYEEGTPVTRNRSPAAIVPMSEASGVVSTRTQAQQTVTDSIPAWGFGSDPSDGHGVHTHQFIDTVNSIKSGYDRFTNYSGGHCCWMTFYVPTYTESVNGTTMNIYQWMLTNTRGTSVVVPPSTTKTYYVANEGSDSNDGLTISTPWATIAKVNSATLDSGSNVLFKRGQSFIGSITPTSNVIYSAYGTGNKPIINGFTYVSTWTNMGGNIWQSTDTVATNLIPNIVLVGGNITAMGRTPNTGYDTISSATTTSVTATGLSSGTWTGAEIVTRDMHWILSRRPITSQSGNTVNFTAQTYNPQAGWGYFIQNSLATLDVQNEWYYNPTTKKISIYSVGTPAIVKIPTVAELSLVEGKANVHFSYLAFQGANEKAIHARYSNGITIDSCDFQFNGDEVVYGQNYGSSSPNITVQNSNFANNINSAIILENEFTGATIQNNTFTNTGMVVGMGGKVGSSDGQQVAVFAEGANTLIQGNNILNVGAIGIRFAGQSTKVKNNFIDSFCIFKGDQGGIYTYGGSGDSSKEVTGNILTNGGIGNHIGTPVGDDAHGIYMDDYTNGVLIQNNTVYNTAYSGIFLHLNTNIKVLDNIVFGVKGYSFLIAGSGSGLTIKRNQFIAKDSSQMCVSTSNPTGYATTILDSNYYARPIDDNQVFFTDYNSATHSLSQWQSLYGVDLHSQKSPIALSDTSKFKFLYNATSSSSTKSFTGSYEDIKGTSYTSSITLPAYSGAVLMQTAAGALTVNAGVDIALPDTLTYVQLNGTCSDPSATLKWRLLNPVTNYETELGRIVSPKSLSTWVWQVSYSWSQYYDYELSATVGGTTVKDTVRVTPFWANPPNTPQASPSIRMVNSTDVTNNPGMSIGDAIIEGANDKASYESLNTSIYINNPAIGVHGGKHIWAMKGRYNSVQINFVKDSIKGTPTNPVIFTNYGGQFEAKGISITNIGTYVKFTGKYQAGVSGNVNYKGHDSSYVFSRGKYGIWAHKDYGETSTRGVNLQGTAKNVELSYIEMGDGGFAGMMMNTGNNEIWDSINFNNLYIHNTSGEGNYLGSTGDTSVLRNYFTNSSYKNNRVIYTGNEILQFGQLGTNNVISNNVLVAGGLRWRSTFEAFYQANSLQLGWRSGGNKFVNNILRGAGDQNINMFYQPYSQIPITGDTNLIANNYVGGSRSFVGNYNGVTSPLGTTPLSVRNNYFSNYNFQGDSVYLPSSSAGVNTNQLYKFENGSNTTTPIIFKNNQFDGVQKSVIYFSNTTNVTQSNNVISTIYKPVFVNSGWSDTFDWTRLEIWTDSIFNTFGDEYGGDRVTSTKFGQAAYYQMGDYVTMFGKVFTSKINNNTGHLPTTEDAYWHKLTWTDGVKVYDYPPDDFRLQTGDMYNSKGIGLTDNIGSGGTLPVIIRDFFIKKRGSKFVFK